MLTELYHYALDKGLSARPGFKPKRVKGYLMLSSEGELLGVQLCPKDAPSVYAPDIGAAAQGPRYCNPFIEKAKITLGVVESDADKNVPAKHEFYLKMLREAAEYEPRLAVAAAAIEAGADAMAEKLRENGLKLADPIGFSVDGFPVERSTAYYDWWSEFRLMFATEKGGDVPRCLITGQLLPALETVPKVSGLIRVGGHTAGDAFLCFDKAAFQSFGLKKSANAPVSEEAMTAVNAALTELIAKAPVFGSAKLVHWYSGELSGEKDPLPLLMDPDFWDDGDADADASGGGEAQDRGLNERTALRSAQSLLRSVRDGMRPEELSARYYIMPLSGASGRVMVRGWYEGSCGELYASISQWFDDLTLISCDGRGPARAPKLIYLCSRLLKPGGDTSKTWSRIDDELANLAGRLFYSIIRNCELPDEVPRRVLCWLRSAMLAGEDDKKWVRFDREVMAFQLLKAWLCRKQRSRGDENIMQAEFSSRPRCAAYYCGCLMALYSEIQMRAMPEVGVTIAERYYTAASTNPSFALGKLAQLSQHHLAKLEGGLAAFYKRKLEEIAVCLGDETVPAALTMEQQTEFALGFYQERAALYAPKAKKESVNDKTEEDNENGN